ncbi:30S ribosomal protein S17 [Candidatus Daviesbacteria bacterium]|nr:30S ribosomal protein S17 [Candidatus Daviesbacteria bacterium]
MIGRVVSTKSKNTATVLVERKATHPLYKKTYIRSKKYLVHDLLQTKEGDVVDIVKTKPVSKYKHWKIVQVKGKNLAEIAEEKLKESAEEIIAEVSQKESKKHGTT